MPLFTDLSFPDQSDSDSDSDNPSAQVTMETQETFHSMAEIASCSYEARKVGICNKFTRMKVLEKLLHYHHHNA